MIMGIYKEDFMKRMKRLNPLLAILSILTVAYSCNVTELEQEPKKAASSAEKLYPVHFVAEEIETRTMFGEAVTDGSATSYPTLWTENDSKIAVSLNLNNFRGADVVPAEDFKSATFDTEFPQSEVTAPYVFYALSPFSAAVGATSSHGGWHFNIPTEQTPLASSCDEAAQVLVSSQEAASVADFSNVVFHFSHVTAYGKMTLKNMSLPEGATVQSIDLTASVPFAGRFYYSYEGEALEESSSSRTVTLKPDHITIDETGTSSEIWFACAPADLSGGTFKVDVNTSAGVLSRTVDIAEGKLVFKAGRISKFGVNMTSAQFTPTADRWVLVTDASTLEAGDEIIIANSATAGAAYAISTTQNKNNRGRVAISIAQDTDGQMVIQSPGSTIEVLTLVSGAYSGYFYLQETTSTTGRYLGTTSSTSDNYLHSNVASTATNNSNKGYYNWTFAISNNVAYITAYQSVNKNNQTNYKHLRYNSNSSASCFSAYLSTARTSWSGNTSIQSVYVFRKEAGINVDDDPILEQEVYGAYLTGGNRIYSAGDQLSREYESDGTLTFAILSPTTFSISEFIGIPVNPAKGDTFTLNYNQISGRNQSDADYNVTVVKVDGPKVWLSAGGGNGFIVKK